MILRGTLNAEDAIAALKLHYKPGPFGITLLVLLNLPIVPFGWYLFFGHSESVPTFIRWLFLGFILYTGAMFFVVLPYMQRRAFNQRKALQRELTFEIKDSSFDLRSENISMTTPWSDFLKWKESPAVFLLYTSYRLYTPVPKRFFASPSDIDSFRDILATKVRKA